LTNYSPASSAGPVSVADAAARSQEALTHSLQCYAEAVSRGADDTLTLANYAFLLWRCYEFSQAEPFFVQLLHRADTGAATLRQIAQRYFEIGRFDEAARAMRVAVRQTDRADAELLNTLAWTLERSNQLEAAREQAEAALHINPAYGPAVRLLAHLDRREANFEQAAHRLERQLASHPSDFDWGLRYELAAVLDRLGAYDKAWQALCLAKEQLASVAAARLAASYQIRQRQWELARSVTQADLRRWRAAGQQLQPAKRICFLTGFPRSGTTLLEQMLAANEAIVDTDETGIFTSQFVDPIVWQARDTVTAIVELRSFDAAQLTAGREAFYRFTESYVGRPVSDRCLVEKNPLMTADLALPLRLFPEASVLFALRDPRDVVLSYLFTMVPLNWSSAPALQVEEACRFYADTMRHWLWWRDRLDWPYHELRYEQIISNPVAETQQIAQFLGVPWSEHMVDERRRSEKKAVRTPTYDDVTKPLYTRAMGRWQNYAAYLRSGSRWLEPFIEAFGYDAPRG
jgi:tetratricopeptide (TPR) repeat protein